MIFDVYGCSVEIYHCVALGLVWVHSPGADLAILALRPLDPFFADVSWQPDVHGPVGHLGGPGGML